MAKSAKALTEGKCLAKLVERMVKARNLTLFQETGPPFLWMKRTLGQKARRAKGAKAKVERTKEARTKEGRSKVAKARPTKESKALEDGDNMPAVLKAMCIFKICRQTPGFFRTGFLTCVWVKSKPSQLDKCVVQVSACKIVLLYSAVTRYHRDLIIYSSKRLPLAARVSL